ncbi:MAG: iron chaperone [Terracidiphilus sp.]
MRKFQTVDEYISELPDRARDAVTRLRRAIRQAAPQAEEAISYNLPAFRWNGILVWYAAFKNHVGFYPKASAIAAFKSELASFKTSKGAIQFPIDESIPIRLVKKIVAFRIKENMRG